MVLHQPVQHGIGNRLVTNPLVPVLNRQLAGDDGGALAGAVINDLQQVSSGLTVHGGHAPVVQQEDVRVFERIEPARKRAVGVANAQLLAQPGHPLVQRTVASIQLALTHHSHSNLLRYRFNVQIEEQPGSVLARSNVVG
jgi:hypothetical protein